MFRALVFDLDDTLYSERDFVMSGYRTVARYLDDTRRCSFETAFSIMEETYEKSGRHMVFPMLIEWLSNESLSLPELVNIYRQHKPDIQLYPGYLDLLRKLARHYRMGIITDGLPSVQERKVHALGLRCVMDKIIYTWEYGSEKEKPHPLSFSLMLQHFQAEPGSALFIGDCPEKDCRGAHGVGMKFAQIQCQKSGGDRSGISGREQPEYVIETLFQLPQILQPIN